MTAVEQERLDEICTLLLAEAGLQVEASYDERHRICVRATCPCSDRDHRRVMAAFLAVASSVRWAGVAR